MRLVEIFNSTVPFRDDFDRYNYKAKTTCVATFSYKEREYKVEFRKRAGAGVDIQFGIEGNWDDFFKTPNDQSGFVVFGTVVQIIKKYTDQFNPFKLTFSAEILDNGIDRAPIYAKLVNRFVDKSKYDVAVKEKPLFNDRVVTFTIARKEDKSLAGAALVGSELEQATV